MATRNSKIDDFIETLHQNPKSSGKIIKSLIKSSNRFLVNLPFLGIARKIAAELENGPFSYYYIFKRTLAHKLHPNLYAFNLNIFSNYNIEKQYKKKYRQYNHMVPSLASGGTHASVDAKIHLLQKFEKLIAAMVENEGHFMVVKFYDYFLHKIDPKAARVLRSLELQINFCKTALTSDKEKNTAYIKSKFLKFLETYGNDHSLLFIERLSMDKELQEYRNLLLNDNNLPGASLSHKVMNMTENLSDNISAQINQILEEEKEEPRQETEQTQRADDRVAIYARKIKQAYLDQVEDTDKERIIRIVNNIKTINLKQLGKEKTDELITSLLKIWLEDPTMPEAKKQLLQEILDTQYAEKVREVADDAGIRLRPQEERAEEDRDRITEEESVALEEAGSAHLKEAASAQPEIAPEIPPNPEIETTSKDDLAEQEPVMETIEENDTAFGTEEEEEEIPTNQKIPPKDKKETLLEQQEQEIKTFLDTKQDKLKEIETYIQSEIDKARQEIGSLATIENNDSLAVKIISMYNGELYQSGRQELTAYLDQKLEEQDLFLKIIRYLEDGPFRHMSLEEKHALLDAFITYYQDNKKLAVQLENYKKSLQSITQLLTKIFTTLTKIEKDNPNIKIYIQQQLKYLEKVLHDDEFRPVWKTVAVIYKNIIQQLEPSAPLQVIKAMGDEPDWKQAETLNYMQHFYRDNKEIKKYIKEQLQEKGLKAYITRQKQHKSGKPPTIEQVLEDITGEPVTLRKWMQALVDPESAQKESIAELKKEMNVITKNKDIYQDEVQEALRTHIKEYMQHQPATAVPVLQHLVLSEESDPAVKELIISQYAESNNEDLHMLHMIHTFIDSAATVTEKQKIVDNVHTIGTQQELPALVKESITALKKILPKQEKSEHKRQSIIEGLQDADDKAGYLKNISDNKEAPEDMRVTAGKIVKAIQNDRFEEAFSAITSSSNPLATKILFLETLQDLATQQGWISDKPDDERSKKRKKRIAQKIEFYQTIMRQKQDEREKVQTNVPSLYTALKKKISVSPKKVTKEKKKTNKKDTTSDHVQEHDDMSDEERIYTRSLNIVKAFGDHIEALDPVKENIVSCNSKNFQEKLRREIEMLSSQQQSLLHQTLQMLEKEEPDIALLQNIQKAAPKIQFIWSQQLINKRSGKDLESLFQKFAKDKDFMNEVDRLSRIIQSNNKNNFLQQAIQKETKLLQQIATQMTLQNIRNIRNKSYSRQDKDKLNLFRDLIMLTGDQTETASSRTETRPTSKQAPETETSNVAATRVDENPQLQKHISSYREKLLTELETFNNYCKSERTRALVLKNQDRLHTIDSFFKDITETKPQALDFFKTNKPVIIALFSNIIAYKYHHYFPSVARGLKYALQHHLLQKQDLASQK